MIKYNYLIERNEGNEFTTFSPNMIPTVLPPLVYIEGPNSSGKSTLLNLIALAFDGNNRAEINENLKTKINALTDHSYQNLSFDLEIDIYDDLIKFTKNSGKTNIIRSCTNGKKESLLNTDQIREIYNLIYDIPENPITRLTEMNNSLRIEHSKLEQITQDIVSSFRSIQLEVKNSQDPEKLLTFEIEYSEREQQYTKNKDEINTDSKMLNIIAQYTFTRAHNRASLYLKELDQKIEQVNKTIKTIQKKKDKSKDQIDNELFDCKNRMNRDIENVIRYLKLIKYSSTIIHEFENITFDPIKKTAVIPQRYFSIVNDTLDNLNKLDRSESKRIQAKLAAFAELSIVLEKYQFDDIQLPGESKSIRQLLLNLKQEIEKENIESKSLLAIDEAVDYLVEFKNTLEYINVKVIPKYSKVINSISDDNYDNGLSEHEFDQLVEKQNKYKKRVLELSQMCISYGVNLTDSSSIRVALDRISEIDHGDKYRKNSDAENIAFVNSMAATIEMKKTKLKNLEQMINRDKIELDQMKQMKSHELRGKSDLIERIIGKLLITKTQLVTYSEYLENMNYFKDKISDQNFSNYFNCVAFHLGKQLGSIRHIDKTHDVKKIDLIHKQIITNENKIIRFNDMGTGQSQAAYLLSKLTTLDHRKVVVLFDEIAMMDKTSLIPVFNKLLELYNEGKLVCAIVVQKSEFVKVIPLSEAL